MLAYRSAFRPYISLANCNIFPCALNQRDFLPAQQLPVLLANTVSTMETEKTAHACLRKCAVRGKASHAPHFSEGLLIDRSIGFVLTMPVIAVLCLADLVTSFACSENILIPQAGVETAIYKLYAIEGSQISSV